jgi:hypothetical protein
MSNLYDTGRPKRVIVEHPQPSKEVQVLIFPLCENCGRQTRTVPCEWCRNSKSGIEIQKTIDVDVKPPKRLK